MRVTRPRWGGSEWVGRGHDAAGLPAARGWGERRGEQTLMAADAVQIEAEDEVPAIIERIRRSPADEVHLVLPLRARFGQSRFEFQLLRQYCTRLGKRV